MEIYLIISINLHKMALKSTPRGLLLAAPLLAEPTRRSPTLLSCGHSGDVQKLPGQAAGPMALPKIEGKQVGIGGEELSWDYVTYLHIYIYII
jgi:hypothetical protein